MTNFNTFLIKHLNSRKKKGTILILKYNDSIFDMVILLVIFISNVQFNYSYDI